MIPLDQGEGGISLVWRGHYLRDNVPRGTFAPQAALRVGSSTSRRLPQGALKSKRILGSTHCRPTRGPSTSQHDSLRESCCFAQDDSVFGSGPKAAQLSFGGWLLRVAQQPLRSLRRTTFLIPVGVRPTILLLRAARGRCCRRWTTPATTHPGLSARWRVAAAPRRRSQHRGGSPA